MKNNIENKQNSLKLTTLGFTLIELIGVLVIMAIIALIVTPLVMNIIRKARTAADKRSIDAYGRSIEIAIAGYLLDNGYFPTSIGQLTIEYSGDEVVCSTTRLNGDSSVYLTGCTVGGRTVDYAYGTDLTTPAPTYTAYSVGDTVTYNNVNYYVIADSGTSESTVTLLKAEPLTVSEVNTYGGVGTANNHVNMYNAKSSRSYYHTAYNQNGYGGMAYYSSENCGSGDDSNHTNSGCTTDYAQSDVKYVVDAWKAAQAPAAIEARLISWDDLFDNLGYERWNENTTRLIPSSTAPSWVYNSNCNYWTMSQANDSASSVWYVYGSGSLGNADDVYVHYNSVRPVITLSKSSI